jgi:hypothetical protein
LVPDSSAAVQRRCSGEAERMQEQHELAAEEEEEDEEVGEEIREVV